MQKKIAIYINSIRISIASILILLIFILGFSVRIYNLIGVPYGFHADEASFGYNAYTILTKGTDEYGKSFPIFFKSFGEYCLRTRPGCGTPRIQPVITQSSTSTSRANTFTGRVPPSGPCIHVWLIL